MTTSSFDHFELTQAILLFTPPDEASGLIAQVVDIEHTEQGLNTANPRHITADFIDGLIRQRGQQPLSFIDADVLAQGHGSCAWFVPAQPRRLRFAAHGDNALNTLDGQTFPQPPLVFFVRGHVLSVFGLQENVRPTRDTPLFHSPYLNTYENGSLCLGSTVIPQGEPLTCRAAWEGAFYESYFSHGMHRMHGAERLTHLEMWQHMQALGHFDTSVLQPTGKTLSEVLR